MEQNADYVIAGAGSAGCVLARRLAQTGASVILLERAAWTVPGWCASPE